MDYAQHRIDCNHRKVSGGYSTILHTFPDGQRWLRCLRCSKTWKGAGENQLEPPTEAASLAFAQVQVETNLFLQQNPDYYPCKENFGMMVEYVTKMGWKPTADNFKAAFMALKPNLQKKPTAVQLEEQMVKNKINKDIIWQAFKADDVVSSGTTYTKEDPYAKIKSNADWAPVQASLESPVQYVEASFKGQIVNIPLYAAAPYLTEEQKTVIQSPIAKEVAVQETETTRRIKEDGFL